MLEGREAEKGMLVRFMGANASDFEIECAKRILKVGQTYTIDAIFKDRWSTYLYLEGIPNKSFKCFMFDDAGTYVPEPVKTVKAPKKK